MPQGNLVVQLTDLTGEPVRGGVDVKLTRQPGDAGTGGENVSVHLATPDPNLTITGIPCRGGLGTMYRVEASTPHYRPYSFFQLIREDQDNTASDDVEFWVKPGDVTDIRASAFDNLLARARAILTDAEMVALREEDRDLEGLTGAALYQHLGPLRKACFLNILTKASHRETADNCLRFVDGLLLARQDRFFAYVRAAMPEQLRQSPLFTSAEEALHDPLPGFALAEGSFKTRDAHANLQVTFMRNAITGDLAADIDIDESSGIRHGFEVIGNALLHNRTNPYAIREFLLASDPINRSLKPDYQFRF